MGPERDIDFIQKIIVIIVGIYRIVIDTPKVWKTLCNGWASATEFLRSLDWEAVEEDTHSLPQNTTIIPLSGTIRFNAFDSINMGLNHGYTKLRFRQNVSAYYS